MTKRVSEKRGPQESPGCSSELPGRRGRTGLKENRDQGATLRKLHLHSWLESSHTTWNSSVLTRSRALTTLVPAGNSLPMAGSLRNPGKARQGAAPQGKDPPALEDEPIFVSASVPCPGCCKRIPKTTPSVSGWSCAQQGHLILAPRKTRRSILSTPSPSAYKE